VKALVLVNAEVVLLIELLQFEEEADELAIEGAFPLLEL
jgi:hypothetical protein